MIWCQNTSRLSLCPWNSQSSSNVARTNALICPAGALRQVPGPQRDLITPTRRRHYRVNSTLFPVVPYWNMWPATHLASSPRCVCSAWYSELCTRLLPWKSGSCPLLRLSARVFCNRGLCLIQLPRQTWWTEVRTFIMLRVHVRVVWNNTGVSVSFLRTSAERRVCK